MSTWIITFVALLLLPLYGCREPEPDTAFRYQTDPEIRSLVAAHVPRYPDMRFAVISDIHLLAPALCGEGPALDAYLAEDRKMLPESSAILDAVLERIVPEQLDFVLVAGDLTKDGERASHLVCAERLSTLRRHGIPVFVCPGNHDIANGDAQLFAGARTEPVATVDAANFADIYRNFGYRQALARDPASLSYIAEPVDGLWLFSFDSCRYRENDPERHPIVGGTFCPDTLAWIENKLIEAIRQGKTVIGFMHHGIVEHFPGQESYYGEYLVDAYATLGKMFAAYGMRFVFTGHYHAQDITRATWSGPIPHQFLCDIETGSLVTFPVPWRVIDVASQQMQISSRFLERCPGHADDLAAYAYDFVIAGTADIADRTLEGYGVPERDRQLLCPQIADAYVTHLQGDELAPRPVIDARGVGPLGRLVLLVQGDLIRGWCTDLPPADNDLSIDMTTGQER